MSNEDIVFNGNNFIDNLKFILQKDPAQLGNLPTGGAARSYMNSIAPDSARLFLATITTDRNPFIDWDVFLDAWKDFSSDPTNNLLDAFVTDFKERIGYEDGNPPGGDWYVLSETIQGAGLDADGFPQGINDDLITEYFKRSFSRFLATYPYESDTPGGPPIRVGSVATAGDNFFQEWSKFMTRTAEFFDGTTTGVVPDFLSYSKVYEVFFPQQPGESLADFNIRYRAQLRDFWKEQALENGAGSTDNAWFIPSQSFDEWFEQLREQFIRSDTVRSTRLFTVSTSATEKVLVIDRILRLLVDLIDTLQRISASQADRLRFLTVWQQAYTDLVTQVPLFSEGDGSGSPLSNDSDEAREFRNEQVNPQMQNILEKVRARRSAVQDEAKQMQTTINQTQDGANQQTQIATALLQQLSTILSQIFR